MSTVMDVNGLSLQTLQKQKSNKMVKACADQLMFKCTI